ncbi:MAG TPA: hypothetical protein EYP79_05280 [Campylobacterales bacterium]|nr:hypothetical protein [Campylobacterales bacterium]
MVIKNIVALMLFFIFAYGNIYEKNCMSCHKTYAPDLKKLFFDYLLRHSSEKRVKRAIIEYLKNPDPQKSIMSKEYLKRYGVKEKSKLLDKDLKKAIDIYWDRYKVIGRIK